MDFNCNINEIVAILNFTVRNMVPIALGALSGIVSERSGIVNIGIEGMMLSGAYVAFMTNVFLSDRSVAAFIQQQPIRLAFAILLAMAIGAILALFHAMMSVRYKVDQIISGTVVNIFAFGITGYLFVPGADARLGRLPPAIRNPFTVDQGLLFQIGRVVFEKQAITYLTFLVVLGLGFALFRTTWGLRTRAIGENPRASDSLGVNVHRLQYTNLALAGMLAGLAGASLTLEVSSFEKEMSAGKGFIALAVMIFGMWRPSRALVGALLFGLATGLQNQLQFSGALCNVPVAIPTQFISMLPYVLTLVVLAGLVGRARPPAHVGQAYEVE